MSEIFVLSMQGVMMVLTLIVGLQAAKWHPYLQERALNRFDQQHWQVVSKRISALLAELNQLPPLALPSSTDQENPNVRLLAVIGPDKPLEVDLAALRKVRAKTQLHFTRLMNVTSTHFERYLERARMANAPVRYVHLAVHASAEGIQFADRIVDGVWLSEHLQGVEVLFLDGCEGDWLGDLLGVVPYVVTVMEKISHHHAMLLTEGFWTEIARGLEPPDAFYTMLDRCPPVISEFAQLHM